MLKRVFMLFCASVVLSLSAMAQSADTQNPRKAMQNLANKYEDSKNITSAVLVKGSGLELMKVMLRKEFSKDVIKGVDMIIIVEYADATESEASVIRSEVASLAKGLEKAELPEDEKPKAKHLATYYKLNADKKSMSDMIILMESDEEKCVMYLGGVIRDESLLEE
jgi:hypothetical protein